MEELMYIFSLLDDLMILALLVAGTLVILAYLSQGFNEKAQEDWFESLDRRWRDNERRRH